MLLPVLNKARSSATTAKCLGNLKQCITAQSLYANYYNDIIPGKIGSSWGVLLERTELLKRGAIMECPLPGGNVQSIKDFPFPWAFDTIYGVFTTWGCDTAVLASVREHLGNFSNHDSIIRFNDRRKMKRPSATVMMADSRKNVAGGQQQAYSFSYYPNNEGSPFIWAGHSGKANCVYGDGSARMVQKTSFKGLPFSVKVLCDYRTFDIYNN